MKITSVIFAAIVVVAPLVYADGPAPLAPPADSTLPTSGGFQADRYAGLWSKSPFAVATSEAVGEESPDYFLVGVANQDGIFYASVVERQNQEHFLLSSDKPVRGLTLKSINRTRDGQSTFAQVLRDGQPLTLKLEAAPAAAAGVMPGMGQMPNVPGMMPQQIPMPGGAGGGFPGGPPVRPFTRFHRPPIHLPPQPQQPQAAPTSTPTPPPPPPPQ